MGAMSLASCSEESSTPDADGGGDGTIEVPLAQVAKPKPNPWLAQEAFFMKRSFLCSILYSVVF